jgi:mycofactocin precursor
VNNQPTIDVHAATTATSHADPATAASEREPVAEQLVEETLVEEVSIDGMCGVY